MRIAPEGRSFVAVGALVLVLLAAAAWRVGGPWTYGVFLWLPIALWLPWFFRDPHPNGVRGSQYVIAPANGKIVSILPTVEPDFLQQAAMRISIFMNVFDVHVNRHPIDGTVEHREYAPGRFVNATLDKASEHNERMSLGIRGRRGPVLVRQIAGLIARRIVCDPAVGDQVQQGERLGIIRFGSRVDTFIDPEAQLHVRVGDRTVAGVTVLAELSEDLT